MNINDTLKILNNKLSKTEIEWYVTGKSNLFLHGEDVQTHDIVLLIRFEDLNSFVDIFREYITTEILELDNHEAKEFDMVIKDTLVRVCAEYPHGTYWKVMDGKDMIKVDDIHIPCFTLKAEKKAQEILAKH